MARFLGISNISKNATIEKTSKTSNSSLRHRGGCRGVGSAVRRARRRRGKVELGRSSPAPLVTVRLEASPRDGRPSLGRFWTSGEGGARASGRRRKRPGLLSFLRPGSGAVDRRGRSGPARPMREGGAGDSTPFPQVFYTVSRCGVWLSTLSTIFPHFWGNERFRAGISVYLHIYIYFLLL